MALRRALALAAFAWTAAPMPDALAREWSRLAEAGELLPGGDTFSWAGSPSQRIRDDGTLTFLQGDFGPTPRLYRWAGAGIETLATLASQDDYLGIDGLDVSTGSWFEDAGRSLVVGRDVTSSYCTSPYASLVLEGIDDEGAVTSLFLPGVAAPGFGAGWILDGTIEDDFVTVNQRGEIAFRATAALSTECPLDRFAPLADAIFGPNGNGGVARVAVEREPAPAGSPAGGVVLLGDFVRLNDSGVVAFEGAIEVPPYGPWYGAVFRWDPVLGLSLVAREGQLVDGIEIHSYVRHSVALGPGDHLAFSASVGEQFPNDALFVADSTGLIAARARRGDPAPGLGSGDVFWWFADMWIYAYVPMQLNALGDLAFEADAGDPDMSDAGVHGVWGPDATGALALKLAVGQEAPGLSGATIDTVRLVALSDDRRTLIDANVSTPSSYLQASFLVDPDGTVETLARTGAPIDVEGEPALLGPSFSLHASPSLDDFVVASFEGLFASVPEPGSIASGASIVATIAMLGLARRYSRS